MSECLATIEWKWDGEDYRRNKYSRRHTWTFDGGLVVNASSSPHVVPLPMSDASAVDPEEAFVASLSSCHMLSFLFIASKQGFVVGSYRDEAVGHLNKTPDGKMAITTVTLRPATKFSGEKVPTPEELHELHHQAHEICFIANSVRTEVNIEPIME